MASPEYVERAIQVLRNDPELKEIVPILEHHLRVVRMAREQLSAILDDARQGHGQAVLTAIESANPSRPDPLFPRRLRRAAIHIREHMGLSDVADFLLAHARNLERGAKR